MRVLAVGNMYPPHHLGGYELVWRAAMCHLRAEGHAVRVLTSDYRSSSGEPDDDFVRRDLRWYWKDHDFPRLRPLERLRLERANGRALERTLLGFRPDVVTWWSMGGMSLSLLEQVRREGLPAVAFVHDDWLAYGPIVDAWLRAFTRRRWSRLAPVAERLTGVPTRVDLARAARYVFVSETIRLRAVAAGVDPVDSDVAPSGIDPALIGPAPEREWAWRLLYVGRIDERKGIDTAIAALGDLPADATLEVVGGGDDAERERLRAVAERAGVAARVRFRGPLAREAVRGAYDDADAVVFPVVWEEPWGLVPIEAMGRGRPVVATGRGGSAEYLEDGRNALLFPAGDAAALAAAVKRLAADPALRTRLREHGLETARENTETRFNARVLREVEAAAGRRPGG